MNEILILEKIADNIRLERLRRRLSQEKLAEMVDISTKYLNLIENRKANPPIVMVVKMWVAVGLVLDTIWSK